MFTYPITRGKCRPRADAINDMNHIDYERLYADVLPSVVSIYVPARRRGRFGGAGSGFVFDEAGHVVTNQHVVGAADRVEVRFSRGDWRVADVVGTDAYTDLAVVRVEDRPGYASPLPMAETNPAPGRPVAALGNPLGLDGSITAGIVSGANRSMVAGGGFAIPDVVQTDAAINPGNSGGPLVAVTDGGYEAVGVNRAKQGDNIGFAVSPEIVQRVLPALIEHGGYRHSYLQIRTIDVSPTVASANDLDAARGVLVVDAHPSVEGLRPCEGRRRARGREVPVGGDVIVGIDGKELRSHEELMRHLITRTAPGESVALDVLRDGAVTTEEVRLAERPAPSRSGPAWSNGSRRVPVR